MKLTEAVLRRELPDKGQRDLADEKIEGLTIRGNKTRASWVARYKDNGKRKKHKLGTYPSVSLADARDAAAIFFGELAKGHKPEPKQKVITLREALTLAESYRRSEVRGRTDEEKQKRLANVKKSMGVLWYNLQPLMGRNVRTITKAEFLLLTDKIRNTRAPTANNLLRTARPIWRWFEERGLAPDILRNVRVKQAEQRHRFLSLEEVRAVYTAAAKMHYPFGHMFRCLVLTGMRLTEVAALRKSEVDLDAGLWTLPPVRSKNSLGFVIPLAPETVDILRWCAEIHPNSDFFFTIRGKNYATGSGPAKKELNELCGFDDWVTHDLRRTLATHLGDAGRSPSEVDRMLNHVGAATNTPLMQNYNRSQMLDTRRDMALQWRDLLLGE